MPFTLLHPALFGFGIAAVSIPILLHLLKRKRRAIPWGAMRFLEEAHRKRRRVLTIEQLILLILRCLLVVLVALGVGSLMLGSGFSRSIPTTMVIVIDNSISSALTQGDASALERNKALALRVLDELDRGRGDQAMLIAGAAPASGIVLPESSDLGAVSSLIQAMEPTDSGFDLSGALTLSSELGDDPDRPTRRVLVIASELRGLNRARLSAGEPVGRIGFDRVIVSSPPTDPIENIAIASAAPTRSLLTHSGVTLPMGVRVELIRSGAPQVRPQESPEETTTIRLSDQQGHPIGQRTLKWAPGQTSSSAMVAIDPQSIKPTGARTALIRAQIDIDANSRDNTRLIPIPTRTTIRVGVIDRATSSVGIDPRSASSISASRWVRAALSPDERFGISIVNIDARRASAMITPNLDALVVLTPGAVDDAGWKRIAQLNASGALIVLTPDARGASLGWLDRLSGLDTGLDTGPGMLVEHEHPIALSPNQSPDRTGLLSGISSEFDELGRAVSVSRSVRFAPSSDSSALVMLDDGTPLALRSSPSGSRGIVVVFASAFDLDWTNLPTRPLFVALMQELIRQGVGMGYATPTIKAGDRLVAPPWVSTTHRISMLKGEPAPPNPDDTTHRGVIAELDAQGTTRSLVVINPDAESARTDPADQSQLAGTIMERVDTPKIEWIGSISALDHPTGVDQSGPASLLESSSPGVSISLWMLLGAGIIAAIEFVLARVFTAKLFESESQSTSGAQRARGARP